MRKFFCWVALLGMVWGCSDNRRTAGGVDGASIGFGALGETGLSACMQVARYLPLETTDSSLVGAIDQLEVVGGRIVLLDTYTSKSVSVFSAKDGRLLSRLSGEGNAPGEFLSPHSFWVERSDSSLYVLDRMLSKLVKYRLADLSYLEEIKLPAHAPLAFAVLPDPARFLYYYPYRSERQFGGNQLVKADGQGRVLAACHPAPLSGRILHGNPAAFYACGRDLCVVPYWGGTVYEWKSDSLCVRYQLDWENGRFPEESLFGSGESADIMKKILSEDYIRFLYVYENAACLAVKYWKKKELYLSVWHKRSNRVLNIKADEVADDIGIGGRLPLPVGVAGAEELVGVLLPQELDRARIKDRPLLSAVASMDDEANPVLVFYTLK